ncbi:MAG: DUF1015 domain-containing protein [Candidatus Latescibacteria bacterium]|nr:DUF1015 domain-containing protein [Candidatus Latescibacterota bacterium]
MRTHPDLGILIPRVYLPGPDIDLQRWAVIAVDQFTSQPEYWAEVERLVGDAPSTLHLTLPEIHLDQPGEAARIGQIQATTRRYLEAGILRPREGLIYVERHLEGRTRKGLMLALDLERYEYTSGAASLIRATEGTIVERLPPRRKIRAGAALELPHILVLIDDPGRTVIEPVAAARDQLKKLYDFELMFGSGRLAGYAVPEAGLEAGVVAGLRGLARAAGPEPMLFAAGDGNHSLAAAKVLWEELKPAVGPDHPARYALVEVINVHDEGLSFEPIHRVLFGLRRDFFAFLRQACGARLRCTGVASAAALIEAVAAARDQAGHTIGLVGGGSESRYCVAQIADPSASLPAGTIQDLLDAFLAEGGAEKIDYVHGEEVTVRLGSQPGNLGLCLPHLDKADLFRTVLQDGAMPRKTFSLGEAHEKRFYMEARQIVL